MWAEKYNKLLCFAFLSPSKSRAPFSNISLFRRHNIEKKFIIFFNSRYYFPSLPTFRLEKSLCANSVHHLRLYNKSMEISPLSSYHLNE